MNNADKSSMAGAFITGTAMGMVIALLIAPKSGKETREDIRRNLNYAKDNINDKLSTGSDEAKAVLKEAVSTTKTIANESKRAAREATKRIKEQKTNPEKESKEEEQ